MTVGAAKKVAAPRTAADARHAAERYPRTARSPPGRAASGRLARDEAAAARGGPAAALPGRRARAPAARPRAAAHPGRGERADRRRGLRGGARRRSYADVVAARLRARSGRATCSTASPSCSRASRSRRCSPTARGWSCCTTRSARRRRRAAGDRASPRGSSRRGARSRSSTRATSRSASPRTSTSSRSTARCASTARRPGACGSPLAGRREGLLRARRAAHGARCCRSAARASIRGHGGLVDGPLDAPGARDAGARAGARAGATAVPDARRVRLGDSDLYVAPERDEAGGPDAILPGFGGTLRDGLGVRAGRGGVELAIVGGLLLDPVLGVRRASIGIARRPRRRRSAAPATRTRWTAIDVVLDPATAILDATGLIVTPGRRRPARALALAAGRRRRRSRAASRRW